MQKNKNNGKLIYVLLLFFFLLIQLILYLINFNRISFINNNIYLSNKDKFQTGNIFFTGDTKGAIDLIGCNKTKGSISRRAYILKKFDDYLYLDLGNFTNGNPQIDKTLIPVLLESFNYMKLNVINLTKRDLINIKNCNFDINKDIFTSSNIEIKTQNFSDNMISNYVLTPLKLKNENNECLIYIGIAGISDNRRIPNQSELDYSVKDIISSLKTIMSKLETADIKILLFNESFFRLKNLMMSGVIKFDLVLAQSLLPETKNKLIYINKTPIVFIDDLGKSLGHIKVYKGNQDYVFEFNFFELRRSLPEDNNMKTLTNIFKERIQNKLI